MTTEHKPQPPTHLKRSVSLPFIMFYGLGDILGTGIYALIGKVVDKSGLLAPCAFLVAAIIAAFTALSYAELSSRYPVSAGAAVYVQHAFRRKWMSAIVGWLVILTGIVSTATMAHAFVGYLQVFVDIPDWLIIICLMTGLGLLAAWGISQSVMVATVVTLVEIGGLLSVLIIGGDSFTAISTRGFELIPAFDIQVWNTIILGGFISFYAYIGFEDMVNVAEEVKNPQKNLPIAIIFALSTATLLYILVTLVAIFTIPLPELINSKAPLALIMQYKGYSPAVIGLISLFSIINGAMIQIIMGSRIIYGMGKQGGSPAYLTKISAKTQTPIRATAFISVIILILAMGFPLLTLAKTTSFIMLFVYMLVNLSLIIIKWKIPHIKNIVSYPIWVPIIGMIFSILLMIFYVMSLV